MIKDLSPTEREELQRNVGSMAETIARIPRARDKETQPAMIFTVESVRRPA
jgi:hypothetical protein